MDIENTDLIKSRNKKAICVIISVLLIIIILSNLIPVWKNPVKSTIKRDGNAVYNREELALPDSFKSILIDPNNMTWLGWSIKDDEDYYCLHASTEFSHSFSYLEDDEIITMKIELVFTEEDWLNTRIDGYSTFYSSKSFYEPISCYWVYVNVDKKYVRSSAISSIHDTGRSDSSFSSLSNIFMREVIVSFDNYLDENDIKDFHNN